MSYEEHKGVEIKSIGLFLREKVATEAWKWMLKMGFFS